MTYQNLLRNTDEITSPFVVSLSNHMPFDKPVLSQVEGLRANDFPAAEWRVLALCHERRNLAEYEGCIEIDQQLLTDLLRITAVLAEKLEKP